MNSVIMAVSMIAISIMTLLLNRRVKYKSRRSLILAVLFVLYISMFIIIGSVKE
ncbi:hypothetical protein GCM10010912_54480 [Paenibacillus albidus]|uniref:DUF3953 domain-containing protein n=1 Tax=Paenibacillus albidus TaxID=2041023 RepID=A0A917CYT9_9BACL|nr:hypothetical protein GCM10010912_54480 [Paenibacillus albidus]